MSETIRIRQGLNLPVTGRPRQAIDEGNAISHVALCGPDYEGLRPRLLVAEGDRVVVPDATFWATFEAVVNCGASPITVDVDPDRMQAYGLSPDDVVQAVAGVAEAVAHSSHGLDVVAGRAEFLPQADDLHVDRAIGDRVVVAVHAVEEPDRRQLAGDEAPEPERAPIVEATVEG